MSSDEFEALISELNTTVAAQAREMRAVVRERDEFAAECRALKSQHHHRTSSDGQFRAAELQVTDLKAQLQQASERLSKAEAAASRTMQAEKALTDARSQLEALTSEHDRARERLDGHESTIAELQLQMRQFAHVKDELNVQRHENERLRVERAAFEQHLQRELTTAREQWSTDAALMLREKESEFMVQLDQARTRLHDLTLLNVELNERCLQQEREAFAARAAGALSAEQEISALKELLLQAENEHAKSMGQATADLFDKLVAERSARELLQQQYDSLHQRFDVALIESRAVGASEANAERDLLEARISRVQVECSREVERVRADAIAERVKSDAVWQDRIHKLTEKHKTDLAATRFRFEAEVEALQVRLEDALQRTSRTVSFGSSMPPSPALPPLSPVPTLMTPTALSFSVTETPFLAPDDHQIEAQSSAPQSPRLQASPADVSELIVPTTPERELQSIVNAEDS